VNITRDIQRGLRKHATMPDASTFGICNCSRARAQNVTLHEALGLKEANTASRTEECIAVMSEPPLRHVDDAKQQPLIENLPLCGLPCHIAPMLLETVCVETAALPC